MSHTTPTRICMPKLFHEAFGEWQTRTSLAAIALAVALSATVWLPLVSAASTWRIVIVALLLLDIAAGAVANFSQGTNDYYKARPFSRWVFVAIHLHILAIGWLLDDPITPYFAVWAFTIATAVIVNLLAGSQKQTLVAGCSVCLGIIASPLLSMSELGQAASLLFLFKVTYSFGVDHYA